MKTSEKLIYKNFEIGNTVRYIGETWPERQGLIGKTIRKRDDNYWSVNFGGTLSDIGCFGESLELVNEYAEAIAPYAAARDMIREAIGELFGPIASLESEDATLLRGPEPHHDAEGVIEALQRVKAHIEGLEAVRAELERMGDKVARLQGYKD